MWMWTSLRAQFVFLVACWAPTISLEIASSWKKLWVIRVLVMKLDCIPHIGQSWGRIHHKVECCHFATVSYLKWWERDLLLVFWAFTSVFTLDHLRALMCFVKYAYRCACSSVNKELTIIRKFMGKKKKGKWLEKSNSCILLPFLYRHLNSFNHLLKLVSQSFTSGLNHVV